MSLLKNWKFLLAAMTVAMFTACAGSSGGSSDDYDNDGGSEESVQRSAPKEKIDENKLKKTEEEAVAITEENHKLRKEIFEAKNKLGISTAPAAEE
ncbi:MAG: hypothetical protein SPM09_07075 [Fibrobacter sp.]|jgi:hypothetical protein|uniref:hypothetical protein n=1 Tax=Fibrobacter sp. TaxID=35828 RepID=UPI001B05298A|nr:hypothetical protein [Fibrobacter sp.]MBO5532990.1 hypothetical protein [Fibrobacter sp.]MDY6264150.1 hypothetical protein [Fibrobacter sp.]MDY6388335.1 hypothetical protein [Fibrobacter sp.]